ncbi:MAG: hypothetical protein RBT41_02935 [Clostridia bacterium]|jgi:hypothetical protein|nr:hypothetical protein [Clostridia bacterium]
MLAVAKEHYRCLETARQIQEIYYSKEFSALYEELLQIYTNNHIAEPEKEAFQDTLYSLLIQKQNKRRKQSAAFLKREPGL